VPFEAGCEFAAALPDAALVPLESRNHLLQPGEPAWAEFRDAVGAFLGIGTSMAGLSLREREILGLVARGLTNGEIAAQLVLSVRTVERHLSNAYLKLGLSGRTGRAAAAAELARLG